MVALLPLLFALLYTAAPSVLGAALVNPDSKFLPLPHPDFFCRLPFFNRALCPREESSSSTVQTALGIATGVQNNGATRYAVKYATAERWQPSTIQTTWALPNGGSDVSALPLACPQVNLADSSMSEDCLSMVLYVPTSLREGCNTPTLMWIHGGSYIVGSASDPGLDGSKLAVATNSIVAVIQYRLGGLGFMDPTGQTNLAVTDVIVAMQFLQQVLPSFGGDPSKITISGQSSGADMVRALLAADSTAPLFRSAVLQSDPVDYGFLSVETQQTLQNYFNTVISYDPSDAECLDALSMGSIINATMDLFLNASSLDPAAGTGSPIRPVRDGTLITHTLDSASSFPKVSKPLLLSTVRNEAASFVYTPPTSPVSSLVFKQFVAETFGSPRTEVILNSSFYKVEATAEDTRTQLEVLGTDHFWKCPTWTFAKSWVANGGTAYVGLYALGATYPGNEVIPVCMQSGVVCHQDDIEIVFGTVANPTTAQSKLVKEMQARYKAFLHSGNPNTHRLSQWPAATPDNANAILLGASGKAPIDACVSTFWGDSVPYDYQVYGI